MCVGLFGCDVCSIVCACFCVRVVGVLVDWLRVLCCVCVCFVRSNVCVFGLGCFVCVFVWVCVC